jgi:hypothetical protein
MKTRPRSSWMRTLGNASYLLGVAFLIAAMAVNVMPAPKAAASSQVVAPQAPALADVTWTGNGTNQDGSCKTIGSYGDLNPGPNQQGWLFVLTKPKNGPWQLTANFDPDGTKHAQGTLKGGTVKFVVYTSVGAKLLSATTTGDGNVLTVSHCEVGQSNTPTPTPGRSGPSIHTVLSDTSVKVGAFVHDTATLSGVTSDAGGTVTYKVYSDPQCSSSYKGYEDTVNVANGVVPNSQDFQFNDVGTFYFLATYSGDPKNDPVSDKCGNEVLTVHSPGSHPTTTPQPLIPVTGADLGGGWSTQTIFFNLGIGFLGLGLVLNGLARSRKEQEL